MDAKTRLAMLTDHVRELRISVRTHGRQINQGAELLAELATTSADQAWSLVDLYKAHTDLLAKTEQIAVLAETQAHLMGELAGRITALEAALEPTPEDQADELTGPWIHGLPEGPATEAEAADPEQARIDRLTGEASDHWAHCPRCQGGEPCAIGDPIFAALHKACGYHT